MLKMHMLAILIATILDLFLGSFSRITNPFNQLKKFIDRLVYVLLGDDIVYVAEEDRRGNGRLFVTIVLGTVVLFDGIILLICYNLSAFWGVLAESILSFYCLSFKKTYTGSQAVYKAFCNGRFRKANSIDERVIFQSAVEIIADNCGEYVFGSLLYLFLGGPVLGAVYVAITQMYQAVGVKKSQNTYREFARCIEGWATVFMQIAARLGGWYTVLVSRLSLHGFNFKNARYIYMRDRARMSYTTYGHFRAAFAGALNIQLTEDDNWTPIGDADKTILASDIFRAQLLMTDIFASLQFIFLIIFIFA